MLFTRLNGFFNFLILAHSVFKNKHLRPALLDFFAAAYIMRA